MIHKHTMLEADMISRRYRCAGKGQVYAVNNLSLKIHTGECHGIVGESGCGKSTLMRMLAGMETPSSGQRIYTTMISKDFSFPYKTEVMP